MLKNQANHKKVRFNKLRLIATIVGVGLLLFMSACGDSEERQQEQREQAMREIGLELLAYWDDIDSQGLVRWEDEIDELGTRTGHDISPNRLGAGSIQRITEYSSAWIQFIDEVRADYGEDSAQLQAALTVQNLLFIEVDLAIRESLIRGTEMTRGLIRSTIQSAWNDMKIDETLNVVILPNGERVTIREQISVINELNHSHEQAPSSLESDNTTPNEREGNQTTEQYSHAEIPADWIPVPYEGWLFHVPPTWAIWHNRDGRIEIRDTESMGEDALLHIDCRTAWRKHGLDNRKRSVLTAIRLW